MNDFELEAWEVPPGFGLPEPGTFVTTGPLDWKGAPTMWAMKLAPLNDAHNLAFFRPAGEAINYVLLERDENGQWKICAHKTRVPQTKISENVRFYASWGRYALGRLFFLEQEMCLVEAESGAWVERNRPIAPFHLPFDAMNEPSERVFAWLQQQWKAPDSEMRFACQWNSWNEEEKLAFYEGHAPDWNDLLQLMRDVAQLELLPEENYWLISQPTCLDDADETLSYQKRLDDWGRVFIEFFLPRFQRLEDAPLYVQNDYQMRLQNVYLYGEDVSQHERLEARFRLRQWLQQNAPERMDLLP